MQLPGSPEVRDPSSYVELRPVLRRLRLLIFPLFVFRLVSISAPLPAAAQKGVTMKEMRLLRCQRYHTTAHDRLVRVKLAQRL